MTSFGRGRGWASQNPAKNQDLPRPGNNKFGANNVVTKILEKLDSCDEYTDISPQLIQEIADLVTIAINEDGIRYVCDSLWEQAIIHHKHSLATKIAVVFSDNKVALLEDKSNNFIRNRFLRFLQDNYMSKDKDRIEDRMAFANKVLLHAEVYYNMRLSDGNRLKILAEPLVQYLEDLLQDNPMNNIYFIMIQILRFGKDLFAVCPEGLENIIMTIRQLLVKENLQTPENYAALLLVIELANNDYEIKNMQVKQFYLCNIKSLGFEHPFSHEELKVVVTTKNDNQLQDVDNNQQIVREDLKSSSKYGKYYRNKSLFPNVPRAIRGSGASDKSKKETNVNAKSNSLKTPPREKNKGWGHDDRFHEHYE